jgi:hypothetical protein
MKTTDIGFEKFPDACCPFVEPKWYTCADCVKYKTCEDKENQVSIGTKVKELVANMFTCFVLRKEDAND